MKALVLNAGSSSQKSCLYELGGEPPLYPPQAPWQGKIEWEGGTARMRVRTSAGAELDEQLRFDSRRGALDRLLETLWAGKTQVAKSSSEIGVVGHRIVHGGEQFREPAVLTAEVRAAIAELSSLAPVHLGIELEGVDLVEEKLGGVTQIGVFDTSFHRSMPEHAANYALPREWSSYGIKRYGFHGINHEYCAARAAQLLRCEGTRLKVVTCHLGNGCSLAAIRGGGSVDTTMGFTPLEGLVMGTRSGSIDPAIVAYVIREKKLSAQEAETALNKKSGLLGVSGVSSDMRKIVAAMKEGHAGATLAFEMFVYRLRSSIAAMMAGLGGAEAVVFSGGIGENSREVRAAACAGLAFAGVRLDEEKNNSIAKDGEISREDSTVRVLVIEAQEDWSIARECYRMAGKNGREERAQA